jgi:hypothetical protein
MRREVRVAMRAEYKCLHNYDKVGLSWSISGGMAWSIMREKNYWPKDEKIQNKIKQHAREIGIVVSRRKRDLWSMSVEELLWRLLNREEINGNN